MADLDYTRKLKTHEKKGKSVMVTTATFGTDTDVGDVPAASNSLKLGILPPNAHITAAYVFTKTVSDAATSAAVTLGSASANTSIMTAGNLKTAGKTGTAGAMQDTGTGMELWANIAIAGAVTADVGEFDVVVEYTEYDLGTGDLTRMTQGLA